MALFAMATRLLHGLAQAMFTSVVGIFMSQDIFQTTWQGGAQQETYSYVWGCREQTSEQKEPLSSTDDKNTILTPFWDNQALIL